MTQCDFRDVRGQNAAIAKLVEQVGAGWDDVILLVGPPGIGKTMLARRIPTILEIGDNARRWLTAEYDALGLIRGTVRGPAEVTEPPFRAPHHTISTAAMVGTCKRAHRPTCKIAGAMVPANRCTCPGGGDFVTRAGEMDLARFGVLFLDELNEFSRVCIGEIARKLRTMGSTRPLIVASVTPCPCGWYGYPSTARVCTCPEQARKLWSERTRTYGALLGGFTEIRVEPIGLSDLRDGAPGPSSAWIRDRLREVHESPALDTLSEAIATGQNPAEADWIEGWNRWCFSEERPHMASVAAGWDAAAHVNENSAVKPDYSEAAEQYRRHHATREAVS